MLTSPLKVAITMYIPNTLLVIDGTEN